MAEAAEQLTATETKAEKMETLQRIISDGSVVMPQRQPRIFDLLGQPMNDANKETIARTIQEHLAQTVPVQASGKILIDPEAGSVHVTGAQNMTPQQAEAERQQEAAAAAQGLMNQQVQDALAGGTIPETTPRTPILDIAIPQGTLVNNLGNQQYTLGPGYITQIRQNTNGTTEYTWTAPGTGAATSTALSNAYYTITDTATQYVPLQYNNLNTNVTFTTATNYTTNAYGQYNVGDWITGTLDGNGQVTWHYVNKALSEEELAKQQAAHRKSLFKSKLKNQLTVIVKGRNTYGQGIMTEQEAKARDTLRDMISEADWRRYVTNSFLMIRGESGKWYQVFSNHNNRIKVYEKNKHIANLCIHTDAECPPTDHVISMKVLIELDEERVWKESNVFWTDGKCEYANGTTGQQLGNNLFLNMNNHHDVQVTYDQINAVLVAAQGVPNNQLYGDQMITGAAVQAAVG